MKAFFDSIARTPGVLLLTLMRFGFLATAAFEFAAKTGAAGPYLLAANALLVTQIIVIVIHQFKKLAVNNENVDWSEMYV